MSHVLSLTPVITEKSLRLAELGQFTFLVSPGFNKLHIADTVAAAYKVHPIKVNIAKLPRKAKFRGRIPGYTSAKVLETGSIPKAPKNFDAAGPNTLIFIPFRSVRSLTTFLLKMTPAYQRAT